MHQVLKFFFGMKLYMFRTVPLSIIRTAACSCQQTCMTYTIAVCTVKNSWWWTEELSETCRVLFQEWIWEISASSWFYYKKFIVMHGHMNVKYLKFCPSNLLLLVPAMKSLNWQNFMSSLHTFMPNAVYTGPQKGLHWRIVLRTAHCRHACALGCLT